jgi:hypothetical protein
VSATTVMLVAWSALILAHWAGNKPTVNVRQVIEMVMAILLVAFLESSERTEPIAQGLAWLFLAATLLSNGSVLGVLAKRSSTPAPTTAKKA